MKYVRWVNFYPPTDGNGPESWNTTSWISYCLAEKYAKLGRIACIRVEFETGEGIQNEKVATTNIGSRK